VVHGAAHQPSLAAALHILSISRAKVGDDKGALLAQAESVGIYHELASRNPDLYRDECRQRLSALQREYDQRGMQYDAILLCLGDPPNPS
jgi:hypothetical protein